MYQFRNFIRLTYQNGITRDVSDPDILIFGGTQRVAVWRNTPLRLPQDSNSHSAHSTWWMSKINKWFWYLTIIYLIIHWLYCTEAISGSQRSFHYWKTITGVPYSTTWWLMCCMSGKALQIKWPVSFVFLLYWTVHNWLFSVEPDKPIMLYIHMTWGNLGEYLLQCYVISSHFFLFVPILSFFCSLLLR